MAALGLVVLAPVVALLWPRGGDDSDPWSHVLAAESELDHTPLLTGPFEDGRAVTRACLECHEEAGREMLKSAHFTWESPPVEVEGRAEAVVLGKRHALNNFCIGITGNWAACTTCHTGYGWTDDDYDFSRADNVDCLACHDNSGGYAKTRGGAVAEGVDLAAAAQSVGRPTRENCGGCHFRGGGGNAVKHGDLDESLYYPSDRLDVHMGALDFDCVTCHRTENHQIRGRALSVSPDASRDQVACTDCHKGVVHGDARLEGHTSAVACQTCHVPEFAVDEATKMHWDWSEAGQDLPEDPHHYLKIKGRFEYEQGVRPQYAWYNGEADHYLLGDPVDPADTTAVVTPRGEIGDPASRIFPFKVHRAIQIYDVGFERLIQPKTFGEGGYWSDFDWDRAARLGSEAVGLPYSGEYGWVPTKMYWPITHMVAPAERALQCDACHGEGATRMDWAALGYEGDPMELGGRTTESGPRRMAGRGTR